MKFLSSVLFVFLGFSSFGMVLATDSVDPDIPEDLFHQELCGLGYARFPTIGVPEEGILSITLTDSIGNYLSDTEVYLDVIGTPNPFWDSLLVMTNADSSTFDFPIHGDAYWSIDVTGAGEGAYLIVEECGEVVYNGPMVDGNIWQHVSACSGSEFFGEWSICEGPGGEFYGPAGLFWASFYPEEYGNYQLCFQSDATDSIYTFEVNVYEQGCPDPDACNYTNTEHCDFGACIYLCSECDNASSELHLISDFINNPCPGGSIDVSSGAEGAVIETIEDISSFWLNIEHSYLADLAVSVTCPNGQNVQLIQEYNEGGGQYLGEPWDSNSEVPGTLYSYYFTEFSGNGYIDEQADDPPSGGYTAYESFDALIGCPVNGEWTIEVCDLLGSDNGYLGGWGIFFGEGTNSEDCQQTSIAGCMDSTACNYQPEANIDSMSCAYPGCTDVAACNYDALAGCDDGSCELTGCTDELACNFVALDACDDGSCEYLDCLEYNFESSSVVVCDSTVLNYSVSDISPGYAVMTAYVSELGYSQLVEPGLEYEITATGAEQYEMHLEVTLSNQQPEASILIMDPIEVLESPDTPDIQLDENLFTCSNCNDDYIYEWYLNEQLHSNEAEIFVWVPGVYQLCQINTSAELNCSACSAPTVFFNVTASSGQDFVVRGNGSSRPSFVQPDENTPIALFDMSGRQIASFTNQPGSIVFLEGFASGIYVLRVADRSVMIELHR